MSTRATASFDVTGWDQSVYDEPAEGPPLGRATVRKVFSGDLEGESTAELLLCQADPDRLDAGAGYVGCERFTGKLAGKSGTFVLQHGALTGAGMAPRTFGHVVPGSATGELAGLFGSLEIVVDGGAHTLLLDYDFA